MNTSDTSRPDKGAARPADCTDAIRALVIKGELAGGHRLSGQCTRAHVEAVVGKDGEVGQGTLSGTALPWVKYAAPWDATIRAWYGEGDALIMLVVEEPRVAGEVDALLDHLGEPEDEFSGRGFKMDYSIRDHVYASRGFTLSVGWPLSDEPGEKRVLTHAFLYPPTTPEDYIARLGGKDPWVRKFRPR